MSQPSLYLFLLVVFAAAFLMANSIIVPTLGQANSENKRLRQRLGSLLEDLQIDGPQSLVRDKYLNTLSPFERVLESLPGMRNLELLIEQAGLLFPAYRLVVMSMALGIFAGAAGWTFSLNPLFALTTGLVAAWVPFAHYRFKRDKRLRTFEEQLPDALDMMTRALRAGHPFTETLRMVAQELADPIGPEFRMTFDEINYGVDMRLAFQNMLARAPSMSLLALTTTVLVQRETGGNLAEVMQNISRVIRDRFRFQRKVRTLTAEGRLSAWILGLIPVAMFVLLYFTSHAYVKTLLDDPLGHKLLGWAFLLLAIGTLWIRRLLKIEV